MYKRDFRVEVTGCCRQGEQQAHCEEMTKGIVFRTLVLKGEQ